MRIVLTRLSSLGDIVHAWPLADALGHLSEPVELAWVVEEPFLPLVERHPAVSQTVVVATQRWRRHPAARATWREMRQARAALREFAADVALDPQGLYKSAGWAWLSAARLRVGLGRALRREPLAGLCYSRTVTPPPAVRHVVDFNLALLEAVGGSPHWGAAPDGRFLLERDAHPSKLEPGTVALLPATGGSGKAWAAGSFVDLARELARQGRPVLVVWGPGEGQLARAIVVAAGAGVGLAPRTGIVELAALLAACRVVVGGDTGPVHLAASLGVPTVAIFLASDPERNAPRGRAVRLVCGAATGGARSYARRKRVREVSVAEVLEELSAAEVL
ncbi:MAG: lipopolysaccharide heptosyltransferase I [Thermoanaerobaculales bacterium]